MSLTEDNERKLVATAGIVALDTVAPSTGPTSLTQLQKFHLQIYSGGSVDLKTPKAQRRSEK